MFCISVNSLVRVPKTSHWFNIHLLFPRQGDQTICMLPFWNYYEVFALACKIKIADALSTSSITNFHRNEEFI